MGSPARKRRAVTSKLRLVWSDVSEASQEASHLFIIIGAGGADDGQYLDGKLALPGEEQLRHSFGMPDVADPLPPVAVGSLDCIQAIRT